MHYNCSALLHQDIELVLTQEACDIVLIVGIDGHIMAANNAALCSYGYMDFEIAGMHISQLQAAETVPLISTQIELASVQGITFETMHKRKDGTPFAVKVTSQSISVDDKPALLSVIRDVSSAESTYMDSSISPRNDHRREFTGIMQSVKDNAAQKQGGHDLRTELITAGNVQKDCCWARDMDDLRMRIDIICEPLRFVSGDLCDYKWIGPELLCGYVIDVIGHRLAAALQISMLKVLFTQGIAKEVCLAEKISWINYAVTSYFTKNCATAGIAFEFDFRRKELTYTPAGIGGFLCATKDYTGEIRKPSTLIGVDTDHAYRQYKVSFSSGDSFYFLTDGLFDLYEKQTAVGIEHYAQAVTQLRQMAASLAKTDDAGGLCIHFK